MFINKNPNLERARRTYGLVCAEVGKGGSEVQVQIIAEAIRQAIADEREECAKLVESDGDECCTLMAQQIRKRT